MKTFKTLAATLCLATAAFAAIPAQADVVRNGFVLNGFVVNGFVLNGFVLNGFVVNGTTDTGIKVGTPIAVTLPEGSGKQ